MKRIFWVILVLLTSGRDVYALDKIEQNFVKSYIKASNSGDVSKVHALFAAQVRQCMSKDMPIEALPVNAEMQIFPINAGTQEALKSIWPVEKNYFPVQPTHILQIQTAENQLKMTIIAKQNDAIYLVAACPRKAKS